MDSGSASIRMPESSHGLPDPWLVLVHVYGVMPVDHGVCNSPESAKLFFEDVALLLVRRASDSETPCRAIYEKKERLIVEMEKARSNSHAFIASRSAAN